MKLDCSTECPFGQLDKLVQKLTGIAYLDESKLVRGKFTVSKLLKIDELVKDYLRHLEFWYLDCNDCQSEPIVRTVAISLYCDFILKVMKNVEAIKQLEEGGEQCLKVANAR